MAGAEGSDSDLSVSLIADMTVTGIAGQEKMILKWPLSINEDDKRVGCPLQIITQNPSLAAA